MEYKNKKAQVFFKGKPAREPQEIAAIYEEAGGVTVNFEGFGAGSYPRCEKVRENPSVLKIRNGYKCDEIRLL
jgi:hypothetical protein